MRVAGLEITIPPGGVDLGDGKRAEGTTSQQSQPLPQPRREAIAVARGRSARGASRLRIFRRKPASRRASGRSRSCQWSVRLNEPWPFAARLTNPIPPGLLDVRGTFGPWTQASRRRRHSALNMPFTTRPWYVQGDPRHPPVQWHVRRDSQRIEVVGTTSVPDFALDAVGQPVPVTTEFTAVVDGTNGNTGCTREAVLGKSSVVANGGILEHEGQDGARSSSTSS